MLKIIKRLEHIEKKLKSKLGYKYTYIILFLSILTCYYLGYILGKVIF